MELEELKVQLKQKLDAPSIEKSTGDLSALLSKKAQSLLDKIKRSLYIEIITCSVFTIIFAAVSIFSKYVAIKIYFSVFAVVCVVFFVILTYLFKKTNQLSNTIQPVKNNLLNLLFILREFVKRYLQLTMALVPICTIFSFILAQSDAQINITQLQHPYFVQIHNISIPLITFSLVYIVLVFAFTYYFTRWYLKKLYGNYITQLQQYVTELEE